MSQGSTAYASYVRIHEEMGRRKPRDWCELSHIRRMAWEAAAQAVALSVLPVPINVGNLQKPEDSWDLADEEIDVL